MPSGGHTLAMQPVDNPHRRRSGELSRGRESSVMVVNQASELRFGLVGGNKVNRAGAAIHGNRGV